MGLGSGTRCCLELICGQRLLAMMCWRAAYSAVRTCDRIRKGASLCHNEDRQSCSDNPVRLIVQALALEEAGGYIYIYMCIYIYVIISYIRIYANQFACFFTVSEIGHDWLSGRPVLLMLFFVWTHLD